MRRQQRVSTNRLFPILLYGAASVVITAVAACGDSTQPASRRGTTREWFRDSAATAGLTFVHVSGHVGHYYPPEIMAPGVALFDADNEVEAIGARPDLCVQLCRSFHVYQPAAERRNT